MNAVVYHGKEDVRFEQVPEPACGHGELRVKVEACAVCGSDFKTFHNGNPRMKPPIAMGHEFTGTVETIGSGVSGFGLGDRIVMATSISCGQCFYCRKGWSNLCVHLDPMGFSYPGGMADYVIVPAIAITNGHVVKVPPGVLPQYAALAEPMSCAVNCMENCSVTGGETVVVVGAGPLGVLNVLAARHYGAAKVILAQRAGKRLAQAAGFPCDRLVNTSVEDLAAVVRQETGGVGADVVVVAAPDAAAQEQSLDLARKRGRVCLFASLPAGKSQLNLDSRKIHYNELYVCGASDSTPKHVQKAVSFLARPDFPGERIATPILPLREIQKAFQVMEARDGMRVVLRP
ncbi:MAG TPA: alcohol dehydrogenase catalytic domain-containing protein [Spirochaetia bacterium]|nr:alcohol dehydrogenase catalytic domain-containing protein [Spirochaetia bacterium]